MLSIVGSVRAKFDDEDGDTFAITDVGFDLIAEFGH